MKLTDERVEGLKQDFPLLQRRLRGKQLVYLDNAATTQKPAAVIEAMSQYYRERNANVHRGVYTLSQEATQAYDEAHAVAGRFINAEAQEIIFTRNTTEAINLLGYTMPALAKGKDIVLTEMEHHSNLVPWQQLAKRTGMRLEFIRMTDGFCLDEEDAKRKITDDTAILAMCQVSNALGTVNDVTAVARIAREHGAIVVVDGAQSAGHLAVDVKRLGCDFFAFSGHKMLGPTGIGVLYGRRELLDGLPPFNFGGDMISRVTYESAEWNELPMKFEAGTPNIAGAVGLAEAIRYLEGIGMESIAAWEHELLRQAILELEGIKGVRLYSPGAGRSSGILSFNINGAHAHDVASLLDDDAICIRGGHHCSMPLMGKLGVPGTARASFYLYNTTADVAALASSLKRVAALFRGG